MPLTVQMKPIDKIVPYESNPRKNDDAVEAVARSIREFGFRQPIVVDQDNVIVVGHTRWKAAKQLGMDKVPVHVAKDLTPEQAKAYRIADNQTASIAVWDAELLPIELRELEALNIDLELLGFTPEQLAKFMTPDVTEGLTDPDEVPEPPDKPICKRGDLWLLGDHRLLVGDSVDTEDVDRLVDGATIHLVNTDPPYGVNVEPRSNNAIAAGNSSFTKQNGKKHNHHHQKLDLARHPEKSKPTHKKMRARDRQLENDFVTPEEFNRLLLAWFGNIARVLAPGRAFYLWGGYSNIANYPKALEACGLYFSQAIIWVKQHPVLTRKDYMGDHEWAFYGWREGAAHVFHGPPNISDVWSVKKINPTAMEHLTQKPVELAARAIQYSSLPGENVLDLFGGSGSTLIACEQTGRRCYMMEIDGAYADVIIDRWQRFTGKAAVHADSGGPFPKAPPAEKEALR